MAVRDLTWDLPEQKTASGHFRRLRTIWGATPNLLRPTKPVLANLAKMPFTICGYGAIIYGTSLASTVAAWFVAGVLLIVLEYQVADE